MGLFDHFRPKPRQPAVPPGMRVYAVGDIHGRADLLDAMLALIERDRRERPARRHRVIFLGDYIDRGPDSRGVIERLVQQGSDTMCLAGNHEEVLLRLLDGDSSYLANWLHFGGAECLQSYGVDPDDLQGASSSRVQDRLRRAMPRAHRDFLRALGDTVRIGDYLFVHAGIRPGVSLEEQRQHDLRWIRKPFLDDAETDHGAVVVHGHSVTAEPVERPNRIGIDTGAYATGRLTALVLEGETRRFLTTGIDGVANPSSLGPKSTAPAEEVRDHA